MDLYIMVKTRLHSGDIPILVSRWKSDVELVSICKTKYIQEVYRATFSLWALSRNTLKWYLPLALEGLVNFWTEVFLNSNSSFCTSFTFILSSV